jgi:hypothetical protein
MAALLAALALPAVAEAQIGFGVAAGVAQPVGDFGNVAKAGPLFSGLVNVSIPLAPVGVRLEGSYGSYDYKSFVGSTGGNVRMFSATANAMVSTPGLISAYGIGGIGYYHFSAECTGCSSSSSNVGFNGGVGVRAGLFGFSAFAEARYHYIPGESTPTIGGLTSSTQFIPVSVGITF